MLVKLPPATTSILSGLSATDKNRNRQRRVSAEGGGKGKETEKKKKKKKEFHPQKGTSCGLTFLLMSEGMRTLLPNF